MARFSVFLLCAAIAYKEALAAASSSPFPFWPGFDIQKVASIAQSLPSHSWEYGTAAEALLELYNPEYSIFGEKPFPVPTLNPQNTQSLAYAATKFQLGEPPNVLIDGGGAVGDPASLGISAVLIGKTNDTLAKAAEDEISYLISGAPRYWNGARSHRAAYAELWADFMYMAPPFIAYYGAANDDLSLLQEAVNQATEYRQILRANNTPCVGAWEHIVGPASADPGLWSTGNAWAAAGMTRVLATVLKAPVAQEDSGWQQWAVDALSGYIQEILDAAIEAPTEDGLLINYWNDAVNTDGHGYGEISGSSLLASVAYRLAVLKPAGLSPAKVASYASFGDKIRNVLGGKDSQGKPHITANGTATPAVNPLNWYDTTPWTAGSPEGNNFVVLLYTAWRDCIKAGICGNY
ncbi:hypothetical protein JOM56_011894 [Amanita muscaria]